MYKPMWRIDKGYCTWCHEENANKSDCMLLGMINNERQKQEKKDSAKKKASIKS